VNNRNQYCRSQGDSDDNQEFPALVHVNCGFNLSFAPVRTKLQNHWSFVTCEAKGGKFASIREIHGSGFQEKPPLFFADGHSEFFHHGQHVFPDFALTSKPNGSIIGT
jgi:hypothetical protein